MSSELLILMFIIGFYVFCVLYSLYKYFKYKPLVEKIIGYYNQPIVYCFIPCFNLIHWTVCSAYYEWVKEKRKLNK